MSLSDLDSYGKDFQLKVISSLLTHKKFLVNIYDALVPDDFSNQSHKWIISKIIEYYQVYHTSPDLSFLKIELKKLNNEVLQIAVKESLNSAYKSSNEDLQYVQDEFSTFVKNQQLKTALLESVDLLQAGDFDSIKQNISNALKAGVDKNVGHEYLKDVETRYRENARNPIAFPWTAFNNITQGGYGGGDLVLIFGNPKGGKSWAVVAMAAEAVKAGKNVVFYSLELGEDYVGKRFDAYFTGIPVDDLDKHRPKIQEIMDGLPGTLIIKEYPPKRASLSTIESHLDKLENKPDAIFIDYLDLLSNKKSRSDRKDDLDDVYTDAKGLAKEFDVPVISPSQANRTGADKAILESVHIGGSYDKIMIADIVISLSRGRKDRIEGTGRWHFMGNRYGSDGCTFLSPRVDTSMGHFEVNDEEMTEDELDRVSKNINSQVEKSEKNYMKEKFKEFGMA